MTRVLSRQPAWLDYGTPAFDFFQPGDADKSRSQAQKEGPSRRIACRGTEIFVAIGNQLRWSDLGTLKDAGQSGAPIKPDSQPMYKVLKTPASQPIQQLSVSPSGDLVAVLTSHTCHICVLPAREHLSFKDSAPLKLRSFTVGPTAHVLEQSPLASAIWHPLSPSGNGLVTVTKDACVRLWELDISNRSTFNEPALAVDLKKLANASTVREDFGASKYGTNRGFSPDEVEMQVAASCFGGEGKEDEDGWSNMTLWVAMTEGDVYALCPFLPSKFWAPATLLPSLSTSVVAKQRVVGERAQGTDLDRLIASQQSSWLASLDEQEPATIPGAFDMEVYSRPTHLSAVPRLQGPFQLSPEPDFGEITDIHVVAPKIDLDELFDDEDDLAEMEAGDGLSIGIVCLATNTNKVHLCLNVEGVEAEWLPSKRGAKPMWNDLDAVKDLLLFETIDLATTSDAGPSWSTFTASPTDRYQFFTTQSSGVYSLSLRPWISEIEKELSAPQADTEGVGFRLGVVLDSAPTTVHAITATFDSPQQSANAAIAVLDEMATDVGYVVLTSSSNHPLAAILDVPPTTGHSFEPNVDYNANDFTVPESRAPYQPVNVFWQQSALPAQIDAWRRESAAGAPGDFKGMVRFSPYTLQKITEAHRTLSSETHNLGIATADLFRRCERMMSEMKVQVEKAKELSNRINSVTGEDEFPNQVAGGPELVRGGRHKIQSRIQAQKEKTLEIRERVEALRRRTRGLGGTDLSRKERAFADEVARLEQSILPPTSSDDAPTSPAAILKMENSDLTVSTETRSSDGQAEEQDTMTARFKAVEEVFSQLMAQAAEVQRELEGKADAGSGPVNGGLGNQNRADYRTQKLQQVFAMLERETALVDAVSDRLERLQVAAR